HCAFVGIHLTGTVSPTGKRPAVNPARPVAAVGGCPPLNSQSGGWQFCVVVSVGVGTLSLGCRICWSHGGRTINCGWGLGTGTGVSGQGCYKWGNYLTDCEPCVYED